MESIHFSSWFCSVMVLKYFDSVIVCGNETIKASKLEWGQPWWSHAWNSKWNQIFKTCGLFSSAMLKWGQQPPSWVRTQRGFTVLPTFIPIIHCVGMYNPMNVMVKWTARLFYIREVPGLIPGYRSVYPDWGFFVVTLRHSSKTPAETYPSQFTPTRRKRRWTETEKRKTRRKERGTALTLW